MFYLLLSIFSSSFIFLTLKCIDKYRVPFFHIIFIIYVIVSLPGFILSKPWDNYITHSNLPFFSALLISISALSGIAISIINKHSFTGIINRETLLWNFKETLSKLNIAGVIVSLSAIVLLVYSNYRNI